MAVMKTTKELMDYLKKAPSDFIILITTRSQDYMKTNIEILKVLINEDKLPGAYITINKPYKTMKKTLEGEGVDTKKIKFIDCITKTAGGPVDVKDDDVIYLDSPQNLTGLGVAMGEAIRSISEEEKFLFMDSLSTLLLYHNAGTVAKFSHFLTSKMRLWGLRGILMAVEKETDPDFTDQLSQFCDAVVTLDKG
jgi:KaiC/GvpD/RAD55 family RecA-like ATPase